MIRFLARRLLTAVGILLVISVAIYWVLTIALDPLADLRTSTALNKAQLIQTRIRLLSLDQPWYVRYWRWLTKFVQGDPGVAWMTQQKVSDLLPGAISTSVQLVFAATFIALIIGVTVGVVSALRQYTTFDYVITFISFVLFSLPVFWVAVLLKQFMAIELNNYLSDPSPNWILVAVLAIVAGLFWTGALGGSARRRIVVFLAAAGITFGVIAYIMATDWLLDPKIGPVGVALIGIGAALGVTLLFAGMKNRRALYSALTMAVVGIIVYFPLQGLFFYQLEKMNWWVMIGLLLVTVVVGLVIGFAFGGPDRAVSMRGAVLVGLIMAVTIFVDQVMQYWKMYATSGLIRNRPIQTIGSVTPGLANYNHFWIQQVDKFTHLLLPSIALVLISFAGYVRYERGATLEVLNQDYIRTARSKGLPERVVIVRHALRNALMPLASIIPVDIVSLFGGAVLTETIFGWSGMGRLFVWSLANNMMDPVMCYIMITGALAMLANLMADFLYALLDPRIRVNA